MQYGLATTEGKYDEKGRARIERRRTEVNQAMAKIFNRDEGVDFVITASNPDVAFDAEGPLASVFGGNRSRYGQQWPTHVPGEPAR